MMRSLHISSAGYRQSDTASIMKNRYLIILLAVLLLSACSKGGNNHGTGGISFSLKTPMQETSLPQYKAADIACVEYGIASVEAQVSGSRDNPVATGGPWPCDTGEGTIGNVEEGDDYTISISLKDANGNVIFGGSKGGIRVVAGQITDAGAIVVTSTNNPPVFGSVANQIVTQGQTLTFTINATDPDDDTLVYSYVSLPEGATFDPATRAFFWTPGTDQSGPYTASFKVIDDGVPLMSDTLDVSIMVTEPNQAPVFQAVDSQTVREGQTLSFTISATDPDGGTLTYSAVGLLPAAATFTPATSTFSWTPTYTQSGNYTVQFQVTDNGNPPKSATLDVAIAVGKVNMPPVLTVPSGVQNFRWSGTTVTFAVSATDPNNDNLTFDIAGRPAPFGYGYLSGMSITPDATDPNKRIFSWSPQDHAYSAGEYKVLFRVTDDGAPRMAAYQWVTIQVYDTVDQMLNKHYPVLAPIGSKQINVDQPLQFTVSATDEDIATLNYSISSIGGKQAPSGYSFTSQQFSWSSKIQGNFWLRFLVTNRVYYQEDFEDVVITVGNVNRPPVLTPIGQRRGVNGQTLEFVLTATDPENNLLTYSMSPTVVGAAGLPAGAVINQTTQTFTWDVSGIPIGTYYSIRFTVTDNGTPAESDYEDVGIGIYDTP